MACLLFWFHVDSKVFCLVSIDELCRPSSNFCRLDSLLFGIHSNTAQSSAYLYIIHRSRSSSGMKSSKSSINMLNNSGDITEPCGTPARHALDVDSTPGSFACWNLLSRKFWIQSHKRLRVLLDFSWSIKWNDRP